MPRTPQARTDLTEVSVTNSRIAPAEAFKRDNPNATVQFLDTGHFALETHVNEVAAAMRQFLARTINLDGSHLARLVHFFGA